MKVKDGAAGKDGKSITKAEVKNGDLYITLEGKEPINVGHVQGVKGTDGKTPTIEVGEKENGTTKITIHSFDAQGQPTEKTVEVKDGLTYAPVVGEKGADGT
ncbi:hypothetical protein QP364_27100, partial [Klebsiella pneumoniae]|uniref:hypothetical protein n=1 Tax=Klebsiella pneumoniae TaxID=573 RepID=UPI0025561B8D